MTIPDLLAGVVVLLVVPLNWYVTWLLWRLSKTHPELKVLGERAFLAFVLALVVTLFALVFLNSGMAVPLLDLSQAKVLTRIAIVSLAGPALYWLYLYRGYRLP